jgi:gluconolactonase
MFTILAFDAPNWNGPIAQATRRPRLTTRRDESKLAPMSAFTQRLFAAIYDPALKASERGSYKSHREYVAGPAHGDVLEIGAGTGANLPYYPEDIRLTVTDPNPFMLRRLTKKATKLEISVETLVAPATDMPFEDEAFDVIVATLMLCSVKDQKNVIAEVTRLLRPGGEFRFMEHVRSGGRLRGGLQDLATPLWRICSEGCHPNRNTIAAIKASNLELMEIEDFGNGPYPVRPHVVGFAQKAVKGEQEESDGGSTWITGMSDFKTGAIELVATGFVFTEGPLWHPTNKIFVSDVDARIHYVVDLMTGHKSVIRTDSGGANGATFDLDGNVVYAEQDARRIVRMPELASENIDGAITLLADCFEGARLNRSNDIVTHSSGDIYFTDPQVLMPDDERELGFSAIFKLTPDGQLSVAASDMNHPNGLAFSPDETVLYASNSRPDPHLRAYDVAADGTLSNPRQLAEMPYVPAEGTFEKYPGVWRSREELGGVPDGMKVDEAGRILCTGPRGIWVFDPDGTQQGLIQFPELPANLAFGDPDRQTIYVTARTSVYKFRTDVPGTKLPGMPS